jgi:hypothetical protein
MGVDVDWCPTHAMLGVLVMTYVWTAYFSVAIILLTLASTAAGQIIRPRRAKRTWREWVRALVIINLVLFLIDGVVILWWFS